MNPTHPSLEASLEHAYRQQAVFYEQFLDLSESLPQSVARGVASDDVFREMNQLMDRIAHIDGTIGSLRDQWKTSNRKPGPGLAEALKTVENLIVKLMGQIDAAERAARESRSNLAPKASKDNLHRKMRAAYASAARHA